jgi:hypothetical protein
LKYGWEVNKPQIVSVVFIFCGNLICITCNGRSWEAEISLIDEIDKLIRISKIFIPDEALRK